MMAGESNVDETSDEDEDFRFDRFAPFAPAAVVLIERSAPPASEVPF